MDPDLPGSRARPGPRYLAVWPLASNPAVGLSLWAALALAIVAGMRATSLSLPIFAAIGFVAPFLSLAWGRFPTFAAIAILVAAALSVAPLDGPRGGVEIFRILLQGSALLVMSEMVRAVKRRMERDAKRAADRERRDRLLLETVHAVPWELDLETFCFTYVGPQCVALLGYPREAWLEKDFWLDHIHPDERDETYGSCLSAVACGEDHVLEYRMIAADGREVWIRDLVSITGARDAPTGLIGILLDVTEERRRAEDRLALETRELESQRRESLGLLAGGIAHDFNNLLTGVLGSASLAQSDLGDDDALREHLNAIQSAAERGADLTQQMLAYAGRGSVVARTEDLSTIVVETSQLMRAGLSKDIQLELRLADEELWIRGDAGQLHQIVLNLITNAAEANEGRGWVRVRTERRTLDGCAEPALGIGPDHALPAGEYAYLEVSDEGPGIPPELQRRVTEPFFTTKPSGRGLGLSAVHGIVEGHDGGLWIDSDVGAGTRIRVLLPLSKAPVTTTPVLRRSGRGRLAGAHVLVADDDASSRRILARTLSEEGAFIAEAVDGDDTLAQLEGEERFDLVVLDIVMPGRSGLEILDHLRKGQRPVPVVLTSGYSDAAESVQLSAGTAFLAKPFRPDQLIERALDALGEDDADDSSSSPVER